MRLVSSSVLLLLLLAGPGLGAPDETRPRAPAEISAFSTPEEIVEEAEELAAGSERVRLEEIGRSWEGRPLVLLTFATRERLADLEAVRQRHLDGATDGPAIVWLGFGIHGNEASSPEAAIALARELARAPARGPDLLDDLIVLLDPLSNPDGRARYVQGFRSRAGRHASEHPLAAERHEPWPSGRTNHYLFDLNRDWAWLTQPESRARLAALRSWEPHVLVDLHEMTSEAEYFFPPAAEPVHPEIDTRILDWHETFGRANGRAFDRRSWSYFVRETYDLFYPGYGDSYPSLRGIVGMTFEVTGGGAAGIAAPTPDALSLTDRAERHRVAARTTLETAAHHRSELVESIGGLRFSRTDEGWIQWPSRAPEASALASLLVDHGLDVRILAATPSGPGTPIGDPVVPAAATGDFAVSLSGPLRGLALGLLDPEASVVPPEVLRRQERRVSLRLEAELYDVTAWALPLAFDLPARRFAGTLPASHPWSPTPGDLAGEGRRGAVLPPGGIATWAAVSDLLAAGLDVSRSGSPLRLGGHTWPRGSFWIPFPSPGAEALAERLTAVLGKAGVSGTRVADAFADSGPGPGSARATRLHRPRIGLVGGRGVEPTSFGALWHFLDRTLDLAPVRLEPAALDAPDLDDFEVLVLPNGKSWSSLLSKTRRERLDHWTASGGRLLLIDRALAPWQASETTVFELRPSEGNGPSPAVPGAVVGTLGPSAFGGAIEHRSPPVLFLGSRFLEPTGDPSQDLLVVASEPGPPSRPRVLAGVVWPEVETSLAGALLVGRERTGLGSRTVFAFEPVFRGFWRGTAPLFVHAVFGVPIGT